MFAVFLHNNEFQEKGYKELFEEHSAYREFNIGEFYLEFYRRQQGGEREENIEPDTTC